MGLSFLFGGSGSGKSSFLQDKLIKESMQHPEKQYLMIVPDQFTMETQKALVEKHPKHGIMNIDVLSFGRLSYRVFEETGGVNQPVLDDTGKNLILRIVADRCQDRLTVLGSYLKKQGYIHEIKSAISEFMQYGIGREELKKIIDYSGHKKALAQKLEDLLLLYGGFEDYIREHYITAEESLKVLAGKVRDSAFLKGSVVVFDGFTGFTPLQLEVIRELLIYAEEVTFSLLLDARENPSEEMGEQNLFALSGKTFRALERCARQAGADRGRDFFLKQVPVARLQNQPALAHLEQNLFRYPQKPYSGAPEGIHLALLDNLRKEARYAARNIRRLVREEGYYFRDIAVVCGSLEDYENVVRSEFTKLEIPFFIDRNKGILLNPFVEFIRSALLLYQQDFSIDAVNHYLRSGLTDISSETIDELDNYIRERGIRGFGHWEKLFTVTGGTEEGEDAAFMERLNEARKEVIKSAKYLKNMGKTAGEKVRALYAFIESCHIQQKLAVFEKHFEETGDLVRAREYHQIYPFIIDLLSEIEELSGGEEITDKEFSELLDAGFSEIRVGTIPQNVDHVAVGDMERSRLKEIKVLFFLGINDGNIPKNVGNGGIISDIDREFLRNSDYELAPSPRQKMYTQRLYLYMNLTKPSEKLYLTYAACDNDGKSLRPSYLIEMIKKLNPDLTVENLLKEDEFWQLETWQDSYDYLAESLREAAAGNLEEKEAEELAAVVRFFTEQRETEEETGKLLSAAFTEYKKVRLPKELALQLYGKNLIGSITRLETFAACAYEHFLKYGLSLEERKEFGFEAVDMGNIFHGVLADFSEKLPEKGYTWFDFTEEAGDALLDEVLEARSAAYGNAVLYENARNRYMLERIRRLLRRTVYTLQYQIRQGEFEPKRFEMSFESLQDLDSVNIALTKKERMRLKGRIDRLDICEENNVCYVKVIDYKSGQNRFDIVALYHGLQLQLVTYLNAAMEYEKQQNPEKEIIPAGVLYYHIDDPVLDLKEEKTPEEINAQLRKELRTTGIVNDREEVIQRIDKSTGSSLEVLPLARKKDGSFQENSLLMKQEEMRLVSDFVTGKLARLGREILQGEIGASPYERKDRSACGFCPYSHVCSFDERISGYEKRTLPEESREEILEKIRKEEEKEAVEKV